ncbi:MAG: YfbK domain-containing protein, partial [Bacteroidota bacterium]
VNSYRLIGYEDRLLPPAAFANDSIDAGDLSAGHRVTAIYEIVPYGEPERATYSSALQTQELRYAQKNELHSIELLELSIRYKLPQEDSSRSSYPISR